jgi:large subunit ribosomal protein L4
VSTLKKYNLEGQELGHLNVSDKLADASANSQMVKDYIVAIRANARQWSAHTKTRAEVSHTTKKPHPQKGSGRARHGSLVGPQFRGGGRVFAPRAKFDQHVRINKKERQAAIRALLAEKMRDNQLHIIENYDMSAPKTKAVSSFINALQLTGRVLFLGESQYATVADEFGNAATINIKSENHRNFVKSMRNIPKAQFSLVKNISGYDVLVARHIVLTDAAWAELNSWLG